MNRTTWLKHGEVLALLRVDPKTLRKRMAENPPHIDPPWINIGSDRRPDYRWHEAAVDAWWVAIHRWRSDAAGASSPKARSRSTEPVRGGLAALVRSRVKPAA
jgi:hypothetical protein